MAGLLPDRGARVVRCVILGRLRRQGLQDGRPLSKIKLDLVFVCLMAMKGQAKDGEEEED